MEKIIIDKLNIFIKSDEISTIIDEVLTSKQRSLVHQFCKENGLSSMSVLKEGSMNKIMKISKGEIKSEDFIDSDAIELFISYSKIPIPVPLVGLLNYYLDELDLFYDAKKQFELFISDVKRFGGITSFKKLMHETENKIKEKITSNIELKIFSETAHNIPNIETKHHIYNCDNDGCTFLSIDIKSANFRVIKEYCPTLFTSEWSDYVSTFTDSEFIKTNKMFREIVFGMTNTTKRVQKCALIFVNMIDNQISTKDYYSKMDKKMCTADEIVYKVPEGFDADRLKADIDAIKPGFFHVRKFKLVKVGNRPYFVKEHSNGKLELKSVPRKFALQTIKKYLKKEITPSDLKFIDEGMIATYDKSIYE